MRKVGFLESTWNEYVAIFHRFIPASIRDRFLIRKTVLIALVVLAVETFLAAAAYWVWFRYP